MIEVLRLGHRLPRDCRITTHCCLVARAFGASKLYYSGQKDKEMEEVIKKLVKDFGGKFHVEYIEDEFKFLTTKKNKTNIIHLTMYGEDYKKFIKKEKNYLIIIGGSKVPGIFYKKSNFNISIGDQPHSEVSALGIFLEFLNLKKFFKNNIKKIIQYKRNKKILNLKSL